jgi:ubiquinone/menaquinone biosynthesis C-methylase UbiE
MSTLTSAAQVQADLWSARADDWAAHEERHLPVYEEAIRRLRIRPGTRVLDAGCGSGVFLGAAAGRGARVAGIDASAAMLEHARARVPEADLRLGDLQVLPFADDTFDVVTSFNGFWFAADPVAAVREAVRVARPGAPVLLLVFGRPAHCDLTPMLRAIGALSAAPDSREAPRSKFGLHEPGVLEGMAEAAGLRPVEARDVITAMVFPDEETLVRELLSPGSVVLATRRAGEAAVRAAIRDALAPFRTTDGAYRVENEWHYLVSESGTGASSAA